MFSCRIMTETPVISKKLQKKTLSARKSPKEVVKNVLGTPYCNYWPLLTPKHASILNQILENHLPQLRPEKINIPWKELKNTPREKRKEFRKNYGTNRSQLLKTSASTDIIMGVNEVTRSLETMDASCVMIADDVTPQLLVKHIVDMCVLNAIPVLVVPNLRDVLKKRVGISSVTLAIKINSSDCDLLAVLQTINDIYGNYPVPKNHINYNRQLLKNHIEPCDTDQNSVGVDKMTIESAVGNKSDTVDPYLYRKNKKERIFVPELSQLPDSNEKQNTNNMHVDAGEFLSFNVDEPVENVYKSLIVKRLKGNKNRNKRKIEKLKLKK